MNGPLVRSNDPNGSVWGRVNAEVDRRQREDRRVSDVSVTFERRVMDRRTTCQKCGGDMTDVSHGGKFGSCRWVRWAHNEAQKARRAA